MEVMLDKIGLTLNANAIPNDTLPPFKPSGIRLGTPAITTRGMHHTEMIKIASWMRRVADICVGMEKDGKTEIDYRSELAVLREEVRELANIFPAPAA